MQHEFPEPEWTLLEEVSDEWGLSVLQVLRYAAEGLLQLHAWSEPRFFPVLYDRLRHGQWFGDLWEDRNPVVVPKEAADQLIRSDRIDLDEWTTKDGEHWSARHDEDGYRCLTIFRCRVFVFRSDKQEFDDKCQAPRQPIDDPAEAPVKKAVLIKKYQDHWKGIDSDFSHSNANDLATVAMSEKRGFWYESKAVAWAKARGKLKDDLEPSFPTSLATLNSTVHRLK